MIHPRHPSLATHQVSTEVADSKSVDTAILSRFSARAFTSQIPSKEVLTQIIDMARQAPSGTNTQPWKVYVLQGKSRDAVVGQVCAAHEKFLAQPELRGQYPAIYDYYPEKWVAPFIDRRRACGFGLYQLLGIEKGDKLKMHRQEQENFRFFGAPIGLMFTIDRVMGRGSLLDYGMFLQNLMLAARARGLHTCPQAAWNNFSQIILPLIGAGENEMLVCGMALGYADTNAAVNTYFTQREKLEDIATWLD